MSDHEDIKTGAAEDKWYLLELIYGVLFEPRKTMPRVVKKPPLTQALILYTLISAASVLTGLYNIPQTLIYELPRELWEQVMPGLKVLLPILAAMGLITAYLKWFIFSGIFQLTAELLGGAGRGRTVLTVVGLAVLPGFLTIIARLLTGWFIKNGSLSAGIMILVGLAYLVWSTLIMVFGIREAHAISTGRAAITVIMPVAIIMAIFLAAVILLFFSLAAF